MPWLWELITVIISLAILILSEHLDVEILDIAGLLLCVTQMIRALLLIFQENSHDLESMNRFDFFVKAQLTVYEFGKVLLLDLIFAAKF